MDEKPIPDRFNVRVYGIYVEDKQRVLVIDEKRMGHAMTKFPGGGLQFGEGIREALIREWREELSVESEPYELFYINDFYQPSAFRKSDQILSVYYLIRPLEAIRHLVSEKPFDFPMHEAEGQSFRFIALSEIQPDHFTLPIDKVVAELIRQRFDR